MSSGLQWTEAEYQAYLERKREGTRATPTRDEQQIIMPVPHYRSKTEARFADYLSAQQITGQCEAWWYEPFKLWLAPGLTYTPDFLVQEDGPGILALSRDRWLTLTPVFAAEVCHFAPYTLCFYEAKASQGHVYEPRRALDRLKMAAYLYRMFRFRLAQWDRKRHSWTITEVSP